MKHKLTVNTLAFGNLKHRKKQYTIMIIGIILAMIFSSSVLFFMFSLRASTEEMNKNQYGTQELVLVDVESELLEEAYQKKLIQGYGAAHDLGYAYGENEQFGAEVAWLDEDCREIQYQSLLEGEYPDKEGEIAVEKVQLIKMGIDASVGDNITFHFKVQNGRKLAEKPVEKTYKLVGILRDKKSNFTKDSYDQSTYKDVPALYVAESAQVDVGGKENVLYYVRTNDNYELWNEKDELNRFFDQHDLNLWDEGEYSHVILLNANFASYSSSIGDIGSKVYFAVIFSIVLLAASSLMIINSFNANLKERKKQIGLLRAVGTTRRQVIHIFAREALIISLICAPISVAVSALGVKLISRLIFDETFVFVSKLWVLPLCAAVSIVAVMTAALIPLFIASKISPMQAIRNIDTVRKLKNKRIKTQKQFKTETLLARRNETLHRGSRAAVCFILILTIVFSFLGFTLLAGEYHSYDSTGYDYDFMIGDAWYSSLYNVDDHSTVFLSENDRYEIQSHPLIKTAYGTKSCRSNLVLPQYTDYFYMNENGEVLTMQGDEWWMPTKPEEWKTYVDSMEYTDEYKNIKSIYQIQGDYYPVTVSASNTPVIEELSKVVSEGRIDINKLNSGEEVIVIAPMKQALEVNYDKRYEGYSWSTLTDDHIKDDKQYVVEADFPYKAGDSITIDTLNAKNDDNYEEFWSGTLTKDDFDYTSKTVRIGAVIKTEDFYQLHSALNASVYNDFNIVTTVGGLENFSPGMKYQSMVANASVSLNDEYDDEITEFLTLIGEKIGADVTSYYKLNKENKNYIRSLLLALLSILVLFFAVSASIINNTLAASIRENKREIGTLRAVGASTRELVMSYVKQLISMFAWGYGLGFAFSLIAYFIILGVQKHQGATMSELATPIGLLPAVVMCIVLFAICSINLYSKVRKEMKNSIVENIREL